MESINPSLLFENEILRVEIFLSDGIELNTVCECDRFGFLVYLGVIFDLGKTDICVDDFERRLVEKDIEVDIGF